MSGSAAARSETRRDGYERWRSWEDGRDRYVYVHRLAAVARGILDENFTITEQTDTQTGTVVETTTMEEYTYSTTNSSDLAEELERLSEAREEMVDRGLTIENPRM